MGTSEAPSLRDPALIKVVPAIASGWEKRLVPQSDKQQFVLAIRRGDYIWNEKVESLLTTAEELRMIQARGTLANELSRSSLGDPKLWSGDGYVGAVTAATPSLAVDTMAECSHRWLGYIQQRC